MLFLSEPGTKKIVGCLYSMLSLTNHWNLPFLSIEEGQKADDFHFGTTDVPLAPQFNKCLIALPIKEIGGTIQFKSWDQSNAKASTPLVPGVQNKE